MTEKNHSETNLSVLLEQLERDLSTLEAALAGRLSDDEARLLSSIRQAARTLPAHLPLSAEAQRDDAPRSPASSPEGETSLAHAQTLAYARDLVQTYRQSAENRRRLELTAQQLIRAEKLATIGRVAAAVAHELGNIVTPLLMYATLLEEEAADQSPEIVEIAGQIKQITQRARAMVEQLVASMQGDVGHTLPTDLAQVVDRVLSLLVSRFRKGGVTVRREIASGLPLVAARPGQLEQVFTNVVINALDAMPDGGELAVSLTVEPTTGNGERAVCVRFADTGEGIPADHLSQVFEPFYTTRSGGAGSGLGLFVSHLIIDQHGGTIEIGSQVGKGTTVSIYLPIAGDDFFD